MKLKSEPILLLLMLGLLLFLGFSSLFSQKLIHDFPQGFNANDAFYKYNRAQNLIETNDFKNAEWYTVDGRKDIFQDDSPLAYVLTAVYSLNSNIPDFDAYQFMGIISKIMAVFVMYLALTRFNRKVALISLGIAPFIFIKNNFIPFYFGWIPITLAVTILILIMWVILNLELNHIWFILSLSLAGSLLTHLSEFYYAILIVSIMLAYFLFDRFLKYTDLKIIEPLEIVKKVIFSLIMFVSSTFYYLPIFIYNSLSLAQDKTVVTIGTLKQVTFPVTYFSDFGIFQYGIILGVIVSGYYCYKQRDKIIYFLSTYALIAVSNFPLLGMHDRFYQLRYFWPILFMPIFGLGIYYLLNKVTKNVVEEKSQWIFTGVTLIFIFLSVFMYYTAPSPNSLVVNKEMWDGMQWVKHTVPEESSILIIHGDSYQQHGIFLMFGKIIYQIKDEDYFSKLQRGEIMQNCTIRKFVHGYDYSKRTGLFSFEPVKLGKPEWEQTRGWEETDLCSFEYYVIDKPSRFKEVIEYNQKIAQTLLTSGHFNTMFNNRWYIVLKNEKPGEDCHGK